MHRALLALPLLALSFTTACDAEESDSEFRKANVPLTDMAMEFDIDIELYQENGDGDGTVIWDIKEVGVHDGDPLLGAPILMTFGPEGEIYDAMGAHTCTLRAPYLNKKIFQVTGPDGTEVLYTIFENWLLEGEVPPAKLTDGNVRKLLPTRLLFTFQANEVYLGDPQDGKIMVSASDDLTTQSQNRKLLIGALIEGECGSNGLPGY